MGMAYYSGPSLTTTWNHTCWFNCDCRGTAINPRVWTNYSATTLPGWSPANWKPDKRWRWFDVFRIWPEPLLPRDVLAQAAARLRRLIHTSAAERRRWKRRQWLRAMYAL